MNDNFTIMRKRTLMTQKQFAQSLGMPQSYIGRIESGKVDIRNISLKNAYIFATAFGCNIEDLLDDRAKIATDTRESILRKFAKAAQGESAIKSATSGS